MYLLWEDGWCGLLRWHSSLGSRVSDLAEKLRGIFLLHLVTLCHILGAARRTLDAFSGRSLATDALLSSLSMFDGSDLLARPSNEKKLATAGADIP